MEESHDQSFEDFKPQKVNKKIKQEKKIETKENREDLCRKDCNSNLSSICSTSVVCIVCNVSIEKDDLDDHLASCMEKYKHSNEKETEKKSITGKRREQLTCIICNQVITSLSFHQREEHVNSCLNKQEAKRKWKELGLDNSNRKKPKTSIILECPLCGQSFHSPEARHSHLKTCSSKHNMSTKQLIEAVRLQEKHAKERSDAGLPPIISSSSKIAVRKSNRPKHCKPKQPKDKNEEDLQTALALSASLTENMSNTMVKDQYDEQSDDVYYHLDDFTSNIDDHKHVMRIYPSRKRKPFKRKMLKSRSTPILLLRKEEERVKLLEERVSKLLTAEGCPLWTFSGKKDAVQDEFYVPAFRDLVSPSKVQAGSKLRRLSQLPGSSLSQKLPICKSFHYDDIDTPKCGISTQECINFVLDDDDNSNYSKKGEIGGFCFWEKGSSSLEQNYEENASVKSSQKLAVMFRSLVGKESYSDVLIIVGCDDSCIPAHSLILNVRCPDIMKDVKRFPYKNSKSFLDWNDISFDAAVAFLEVIYSGNTSSQLNNKEHVKKLIYRYNAQDLFEDLQIFLEMKPNKSKFEKSNIKQLNNMLNGIWQNFDDHESIQNSTESQDVNDMDDLDSVYLYFSQKQCKDQKCASLEAIQSTEFLENYNATNTYRNITEEDKTNKNRTYKSFESYNELIVEDHAFCELSPSTIKTSKMSIGTSSVSAHSSPELFDIGSDTEMKLSKSINKLQTVDLKEENTTYQTSLEDSPYHFSEDNYYHEKYSSPFKKFGRKKLHHIKELETGSPIKSSFQKDKIDFMLDSKKTLSEQQIDDISQLTPTKIQYVKSECSPKNLLSKIVCNSDSSSPYQIKNPMKDMLSCSDLIQIRSPQSSFLQKQILSLSKRSHRKCTDALNNSQNEKNEYYDENIIQYDAWDDFHDNGYNEFIADFGMNDNSCDNIIAGQITEQLSPSVEIAANSFVNEVGESYEFPIPSSNKECLYDSPGENKNNSNWNKNDVNQDSCIKRKVHIQNKKAKEKKNVTPMPDYSKMVTPELKQHCTRFGMKKLPRRKAVAVLTHIYEETHPFVTDSEYDTSVTSTPINPVTLAYSRETNPASIDKKEYCKGAKKKKSVRLKQSYKKKLPRTNLLENVDANKKMKTVKSGISFSQPCKSVSVKDSEKVSRMEDHVGNALKDHIDKQPSSQTSSQSETSDILEESLTVEPKSNSADEQNLYKKLQDYIQQNVELYEKILKYEPINLTEFQKNVKESGIKISTTKLMDFFDEECITFSLPRDENAKEKQQKRTKRYQKRQAAAIAKQKYFSTQ